MITYQDKNEQSRWCDNKANQPVLTNQLEMCAHKHVCVCVCVCVPVTANVTKKGTSHSLYRMENAS
jgi:hypothetical protein